MTETKTRPLMKCGCVAQGVRRAPGETAEFPCCVIHDCTDVADERPALDGRKARCYCGKTVPSGYDLAFFEYRGSGSSEFEARGPQKFDMYYCGHAGWD